MDKERRDLLKKSSVLLSFAVGSKVVLLSPRQAYAKQLPLSVLTKEQAATLIALAEAIVPGSEQAGICHYIDHHLSCDTADSLLMIRYLGVPPPFADFYRAGLASTQQASMALYKQPFAKLTRQQANTLVSKIFQGQIDDWSGPSSPFFYFVLRADAVDLVYGTPEGFENLGIPYMPHIMPAQRW